MQVWQLILLQGVGVGIGGGLLYMPVIQLIPEWFSERRGLAGGIIFAGTGLGGQSFPCDAVGQCTNSGTQVSYSPSF